MSSLPNHHSADVPRTRHRRHNSRDILLKLKLASTTTGTDLGSAVGLAVGIAVGLAVGLLEGPPIDPPEGTAVGCWLSSEVMDGTVCDPLGSRVVCEEVVFNEGPALDRPWGSRWVSRPGID